MIAFCYHSEKYGATYADWDYAGRNEAQQILASITSFQFVVFVTIYQYLSHLSGITVKLQSKAVDIVKAHNMISEIVRTYNSKRANIESSFSQIYKVSSDMAKNVGSTITMPCIAARQQNRSNIPAASVQEYFQRNIAIPFLDHIIISINRQFSKLAVTAISLLGLVPSIICSQDVNLEEALIKYRDDLPLPELMDTKLRRWRNRYMAMLAEKRPRSPAKAIKECDATDFPNISVLLTIACTIPVTSCECERSASALRRLNIYI